MKKVSIIVSGSCNPTIKKGAYGCVVLTDVKDLKLDGCYTNTTTNRLELLGVIRALHELEQLFPGEELNIELVSRLNYLTLSFSPGKLRANLLSGESLPNYDLWKVIFELGIKHKWKVTPIRTVALGRYHKIAADMASGSAKNGEPKEDSGSVTQGRKSPKSVFPEDSDTTKPEASKPNENLPIASDESESQSPTSDLSQENIKQDNTPSTASDDASKPTVRPSDLPIIENNDPPF